MSHFSWLFWQQMSLFSIQGNTRHSSVFAEVIQTDRMQSFAVTAPRKYVYNIMCKMPQQRCYTAKSVGMPCSILHARLCADPFNFPEAYRTSHVILVIPPFFSLPFLFLSNMSSVRFQPCFQCIYPSISFHSAVI